MKRWVLTICVLLLAGCASARRTSESPSVQPQIEAPAAPQGPKRFTLTADAYWRLELPNGRFDASGLIHDNGALLVVSDEDPTLYRIHPGDGNVARLEKTEIFTPAQLRPYLPEKHGRFDFEGLARDDRGRIYVCEEADRWILRWDPATKIVERLPIDWSSVRQYFSADRNSSFEGIAIGGGRLWVANERDRARIIEVDLETLKVVSDFAVSPSTFGFFLHYSDLAWHDDKLFILLRHDRLILQIDPKSHRVEAEYNFEAIEEAPEHQYFKTYPTGAMEGLAIDKDYFWLVTDNNGQARRQDPRDTRPTLFRCPRPR